MENLDDVVTQQQLITAILSELQIVVEAIIIKQMEAKFSYWQYFTSSLHLALIFCVKLVILIAASITLFTATTTIDVVGLQEDFITATDLAATAS